MKKYIFIALSASLGLSAVNALKSIAHEAPHFTFHQRQSEDAALLNELNALCNKQLRAAALAARNGGTQTRSQAEKLTMVLTKFNDELRVLAKSGKVVLAGAFPEGGQRPDGRVDASPENLRDTSRIKNGGGEAGNSGIAKAEATGINDASSNAMASGLQKLKGPSFDKAYQNLLISDRPLAEKLLAKASSSSDKAIASFGVKYQRMLRGVRNNL